MTIVSSLAGEGSDEIEGVQNNERSDLKENVDLVLLDEADSRELRGGP